MLEYLVRDIKLHVLVLVSRTKMCLKTSLEYFKGYCSSL